MPSNLQVKLNQILDEKINKIIPENIKSGVKIFNVTGAYEGSGGSGGVKLFETVSDMQQSSGNQEGDLALVYKNNIGNLTSTTLFNNFRFKNTVVLPEEYTGDDIICEFKSVDGDMSNFYGIATLSPLMFTIECNWVSGSLSLTYESSDGITYTKNPAGDVVYDFGVQAIYDAEAGLGGWSDTVGYFIQTGDTIFNGIYVYTNNAFEVAPTQLSASPELVMYSSFYGNNGLQQGQLDTTTNLNIAQLKHRVNLYTKLDNMELDANVTNISSLFARYYNITHIPYINIASVTNTSNMFRDCQNLLNVPNMITSNVINANNMFANCFRLNIIPNYDFSNVQDIGRLLYICTNITSIPDFEFNNVINAQGAFYNCASITSIPNFNFSNLSNGNTMMAFCTNITSIPNFNFSNLKDASLMFWSCNNLSDMPSLNIDNVRNAYEMFAACNNLQSVPNIDFSKVLNLNSIFISCRNLVDISNFNPTSATTLQAAFSECSNLVTVPNFDTSNATAMGYMFYNCVNITDIPEFDTHNSTILNYMVSYCNNLSNSGIQNVINMCLNSNITNATHKNLSNTNTYSPFRYTPFDNSYYSNRLTELTQAGWKY